MKKAKKEDKGNEGVPEEEQKEGDGPVDIVNRMDSKLVFLKAACFNINGDMRLDYEDIGNGLSALMEDLQKDLSNLRELVCPEG
jgi:hypothetical protein